MVRSGFEAGGRRRKSRDALTSRPEIERLLDAARAPASPRELAGEHEAVELFARARLVDVSAPARKPATAGSPARRGAKAALAAAAAVGLLSSGVAFATTGHVPFVGTVKQAARHLMGQDDAGQDDSGHQAHQGDGRQGPKGDQAGLPHGPKVVALQGLCHAYARGQKTSHGTALRPAAVPHARDGSRRRGPGHRLLRIAAREGPPGWSRPVPPGTPHAPGSPEHRAQRPAVGPPVASCSPDQAGSPDEVDAPDQAGSPDEVDAPDAADASDEEAAPEHADGQAVTHAQAAPVAQRELALGPADLGVAGHA